MRYLVTVRAAPYGCLMPDAQLLFDDAGTPLSDVTFVVVDLETTGGPPVEAGITEIGAVKVRGGSVIGEFATLVNPGIEIPPFIASLTGITNSMLAGAPTAASVIPSFLEFSQGAVLVAHNAPYDMSFLKGACNKLDIAWPKATVLDTAKLARYVLSREDVRNCKLATLAAFFRSGTTPSHRALADARATVDVLHGLIERVGSLGVHSLEELLAYSSRVSPAQRAKRYLADHVPAKTGVYIFEDANGRPLYVGTSVNMRSRVRNYFTASETRSRMAEMLKIAESIRTIECASTLESSVRELRLIVEHKPRYNRRSRNPERQCWLKLTVEPYPRLSIVRTVRSDGGTYLGPFRNNSTAESARDAILETFPLRSCTPRLPIVATLASPGCVLAEMDRCPAPCSAGITVDDYADIVEAVRSAMSIDVRPVVEASVERMRHLADIERFEDASAFRDRLANFIAASHRTARIGTLALVEHLVAAAPTSIGGWEVHVVRHGRLAGTGIIPPRVDPRPHIDAIVATADAVEAPAVPHPAGLVEEAQLILRWLESDGVRLVDATRALALPVHCGGSWLSTFRRASAVPLEEPRTSRPRGPRISTSRIASA